MTTVIAAYAAAIGTMGLAWQIYSWVRTHKTNVKVSLSNAVIGAPSGVLHVLAIEAQNHSEYELRVTSFGLEANDGSKRQLVFIDPVRGSGLPGTISAHDAASGYQPIGAIDVSEVDLTKPVVAFVQTTMGRHQSRPMRLVA
jgi:hypothetical protein